MEKTYDIRALSPDDREALREAVEIEKEVALCDYAPPFGMLGMLIDTGWSDEVHRSALKTWLEERPGRAAFALYEEGRMAGAVAWEGEEGGTGAVRELVGWSVRRRFRGEGKGLALLRFAAEEMRRDGARELTVTSYAKAASGALLRALGGEAARRGTREFYDSEQETETFRFDLDALARALDEKAHKEEGGGPS